MRLGYVSDLPQAAPLVGVREGLYTAALGPRVSLRPVIFVAGTTAAAALTAGTLDAAYLDPNVAYEAFAGSKGSDGITVIAGAASGGAMLVTRSTITGATDLGGRTIAVPRPGSAQDVALRTWLGSQGLVADQSSGVSIVTMNSQDTLAAFRAGQIDGAWLPEPWATRLVTDGGGRILVDERALWPGGAFSSALLAVRTAFLRDHPDRVRRLLVGHVAAEDLLRTNGTTAERDVALEISSATAQDVSASILPAWSRMHFTDDPLVATLQEAADHAKPAGTVKRPDLRGFVDVAELNAILRHDHRATVGQ